MFKCCICGHEMQSPTLWACSDCYDKFGLPLLTEDWPAWAKAQRRREEARRRFKPSYGVPHAELNYAPYPRYHENKTYRQASHVRKEGGPMTRVQADDLFYSSREEQDGLQAGDGYRRVLESMPGELRERLLQHAELKAILNDAVRSLPLISQRAIYGYLSGYGEDEMADFEGVSVDTMRWLLASAKERLADLLRARVGADNGTRFVEG
ncbi:MAG: hypothetical protein H5T69_06120 [Chloroflexi bacterium]|nr:hypothetical protein [Chloroflexota bacterium]